MGRNYSNKNMSDLELANIEFYLNLKKGFTEIANLLGKSESTIRKEVKKYSSYFGKERSCSHCLNKVNCNQKYLCNKIIDKITCSQCKYCRYSIKICPNYKVNINCKLLKKNHHVCNGCDFYNKCDSVKIKYHAETAIKKHYAVKRISTMDVKLTSFPQDFKDYLSNRITNGISPDVILNTLPNKYKMYKVSTPTLYSWVNKGLLNCNNVHLRNKVSRITYGTGERRLPTVKGHHLNGRSIEDISEIELSNKLLGICELDTVEGIKGGELLFTIMIPYLSLMLAFKISKKTQNEVCKKLDYLEKKLGRYFYILFNKGILDNGREFLNFDELEKSINENIKKRMNIYYTHTYAAYEKPHVENNHILLRWLVKKGFDISLLSSDDILDIINRLNNYPRPKKDYKTPLQLLEQCFGPEILKLLDLQHIPIDKLNMRDIRTKKQE